MLLLLSHRPVSIAFPVFCLPLTPGGLSRGDALQAGMWPDLSGFHSEVRLQLISLGVAASPAPPTHMWRTPTGPLAPLFRHRDPPVFLNKGKASLKLHLPPQQAAQKVWNVSKQHVWTYSFHMFLQVRSRDASSLGGKRWKPHLDICPVVQNETETTPQNVF